MNHVRRRFARQPSEELGHAGGAPCLGVDLKAWFNFWDTNQSGSLEREELVRGLIRSNDAKGPRQRLEIRRLVTTCLKYYLWKISDEDDDREDDDDDAATMTATFV